MLEEVLQQLVYQHLLLDQPTEHLQQGTVGPRQGVLGVSISKLCGPLRRFVVGPSLIFWKESTLRDL